MAEVTRSYSNFPLPELDRGTDLAEHTLVGQSSGLGQLLPAVDAVPADSGWVSTLPLLEDVVALYEQGWSLNRIAIKLGIAWDSVARLLDRAGVRERKNKSR